MNTAIFFLSTISLGAMAGISGNHYFEVKEMVRQHEEMIGKSSDLLVLGGFRESDDYLVKAPIVEDPLVTEAAEATIAQAEPVKQLVEENAKNERDDALLEFLTKMRADQETLKRQLAETNRDLAEANFRLDTHSDSFKPLRVESERPRSLENSLNTDGVDLLPPK